MRYTLLILGMISLLLSFILKEYFLQFLVVGALLLGFYLAERNKLEMGELKKLVKEHNELMKKDIEELEKTINNTPADVVIIATPIDLRKIIKINKQCLRVSYELEEISKPDLKDVLRTHSVLDNK